MAYVGESSLPKPSPTDDKPVIVRVKRKAFQSRLDAFWLEIDERPVKRPLLHFSKLSLSDSSSAAIEVAVEFKRLKMKFRSKQNDIVQPNKAITPDDAVRFNEVNTASDAVSFNEDSTENDNVSRSNHRLPPADLDPKVIRNVAGPQGEVERGGDELENVDTLSGPRRSARARKVP